ncbi:RlpA-like double-psi beta-barrel-protein domain-containing protein-containing protein [Mycena albidolilacea]|uniref:RlpA-like double-psi beta-barrel-protein domain-containing protein-containing protein n=1 Tax=Mycena albidolilacea TaxID=1033008 RepID=A0AAD7APL7_9AGAR|nr:RlpA-like double-psi beta-barrel-protein domain-containing protein-containing protein [Mycena albidolilacea]
MFSQVFTPLFAIVLTAAASAAPATTYTGTGKFPFNSSSKGRRLRISPATYYLPNGGTGACGTVLQNSDFILALGEGHWDDGAHCGETVTVGYNGASISVVVADRCPGCQGDNVDLSQGAMSALDPNWLNDGAISVQWTL